MTSTKHEPAIQRSTKIVSYSILAAFLIAYSAIQAWIMVASNFYAYLNDFWFLRKLADNFSGTNIAALQDGFFPYLYPLIQSFIPESVALPFSTVLSFIASLGTIVMTYAAANRIVGPAWALVAVWIVALQPTFFTYATVAGADALSVFFVAASVLVLTFWIDGKHAGSHWLLFISGFLIGVGATLRHHILLLALIPLTAALLSQSKKKSKAVVASLGGVFIAYIPQMIVNISDGYGPYMTLQGFNVYRTVVGVDWSTTASLDPALYSSPLRIITSYPFEFANAYLSAWSFFAVPVLLIAAAAVVLFGTKWQSVLTAILAAAGAYAITTSVAFSDRTLMALAPLLGLGAALIAGRWGTWLLHPWITLRAGSQYLATSLVAALIAAVLLWLTLPWLEQNILISRDRIAMEDTRSEQESNLLSLDPPESMDQVLSLDFNFYSTAIPGAYPQVVGGIQPVSQPDLWTLDLQEGLSDRDFQCELANQGISRILWNQGALASLEQLLRGSLREVADESWMWRDLGDGLIQIDAAKIDSVACD